MSRLPAALARTARRSIERLRGVVFALSCGCAVLLAGPQGRAAETAQAASDSSALPPVRVLGTPLFPGSGLLLRTLPANAQIDGGDALRRRRPATLADFLERNAGSIGSNAVQGNPYQPDLAWRGFVASPLLGTPQGVSVFVDGMRVNEPFGDVVNWDLLPPSAISSIQRIPGASPLFGLNTLGGAVSVYTRRGAIDYADGPGASATLSGGSFGRRSVVVETGGRGDRFDWFATGDSIRDPGWAKHNASRLARLFAKLGWRSGRTDVELAASGADNRLEGTQTLPASFEDIRDPYTFPDTNFNRLASVSVKAAHALADALVLSGNAYLRQLKSRNVSSNVEADDAAVAGVAAVNDESTIDQRSAGIGLQIEHSGLLAGHGNRLVLGVALDEGRARFTRQTQEAVFAADRGTIALGGFVPDTDADSTTRHLGVFASNVLDLDERWALTLSARLNRASVRIADRSGTEPSLDGSHSFARLNRAVGITFSPTPAWSAWASYNEGMRAPTAIELTCADADAPCRLPNSFVADPPLAPVLSSTIEVGLRGQGAGATRWSAALFRTDLDDDIQFIASSGIAVNAGFFRNVGRTRRQGLELDAQTRLGPMALSAHYGFVDARFATDFVENSPANSSARADGTILVHDGDRIPAIARHLLKLRLDLAPDARWSVGVAARLASASHARGDENNRDVHGRLPGHAVVDFGARLRVAPDATAFARVDNVFDRRYASFATLASNVFTGPGHAFDPAHARIEPFLGYGMPRSVWIGIEYSID